MPNFFSKHKRTFLALIAAFLYSITVAYATPPISPYSPAETLDPACAPGSANCSVSIYPDQTGQAGNVLTTDGSVVSWSPFPAVTNIYNTDGTLTGARTLTLSSNSLDIAGATTTRFFSNGNIGVGTTTDAGYKLQVNGNTRVSGQLTVVGVSGMIGGVTNSDFISGFNGTPSTFQVNQTAGNYGLVIGRSDNGGNPAHLSFYRTRGGGIASTLGALVNGDNIGTLNFFGVAANGSTQFNSATIAVSVYPTGGISYLSGGAVPPTNALPSLIQIMTTGFDGVKRRRLDIFPDGEVILSNTGFLNWSNGYKLQVDGNTSLHGNVLLGAAVGSTINASAVVEISSTSKGFLPPRMTNAQRTAIGTPAVGLVAYGTDATEGLYLNLSGGWQRFLTTADVSGNIYNTDGSLTGARTLTLNSYPLDIVGTTASRFFANGNVAIGTTTDNGFNLDVEGDIRGGDRLYIGPLPENYAPARINISSFGAKNTFVNSVMTLSSTETGAGGVYPTQLVFAQEGATGWSWQSVNQGVSFSNLMFNPNGGDVLIGTTTDSGYKLDVNGTTKVEGVLTAVSAVKIGSNSAPHSSAVLDISSNSRGVLFPRMTDAERTTISTPATGLHIYQTDTTEGSYVKLSGGWQRFLTTADIGTTITSDNIYNSEGTLTGNRTISTGGYTLKIRTNDGDNQGIKFHRQTLSGLPVYYAISGVDVADGSTTNYGLAFSNNGNGAFLNAGQALQFQIGGVTQGMFAYSTGNFLLNTTTDAGYKLDVNGAARITGKITQNVTWINGTNNSSNTVNVILGGTLNGATTNGAIAILGTAGTNTAYAIGYLATANYGSSVIIGESSSATGYNSTVVGHYSTAAANGIALGVSTVAGANEFVAGSSIQNVYFGNGAFGINTNGISYTINGSGGNGTDFAGGNITVAGGKGTGAGVGGDVVISTSNALASGSTLQSLAERIRVKYNTGNVLVGTTTDSGYKLDVNGTVRVLSNARISNGVSGGYLDILPSDTQIALGAIYNAGAIPIRSYSTIYVGGNGDNSTYVSSGLITAPSLKSKESGGTEIVIQAQPTYGTIDVVRPVVADYPLVLGRYANVLIGTTTDAGYKLDVNGTGRFTSGINIGSTTSVHLNIFDNSGTLRYTIGRSTGTGALTFTGSQSGFSAYDFSTTGGTVSIGNGADITASTLNLTANNGGISFAGGVSSFSRSGLNGSINLSLQNFANASFNINGAHASSDVVVITGATSAAQLRLQYDTSNYFSTSVGSTGAVSFNAVGASAGFIFSDAVSSTSLTVTADTGFAEGKIYKSATYGTVYSGSTGSSSDLLLTDRNGALAISIANGGAVTFGSAIVSGGVGIGATGSSGGIQYSGTYGTELLGSATGGTVFDASIWDRNGAEVIGLKDNGTVVVGTYTFPWSTTPKLHIGSTTEQLRLGYDGSNYFSTTVGSTGNTTLSLNGTSPSLSITNLAVASSSQDALCIVNGGTEIQRNNGAQTCTVSSARFKHNIQPLSGDILSVLTRFTPSTFIYNDQSNTRIGLIAEEVATIDPRLIFYEADGVTPRGVRYEDLSVLTLKGLQDVVFTINNVSDLTKPNTLRDTIIAWLGDLGNGIGKIFANTLQAKEQVCIDDVCINKEQLRALIQNQPPAASAVNSAVPQEEVIAPADQVTDVVETIDNTPPPAQEPVE